MQVVIREVQVLYRAVLDNHIDELVHVGAPHTVPTYVQLLQVSWAFDQVAELAVVRLIDIHVDQAETAQVVLGAREWV